MTRTLLAAASSAVLALSACAYYAVPAPATYPVTTTTPASFDRSFSAATEALRDQGLTISAQDRANGVVVGSSGNTMVTATVRQQADGSVRVQFDAKGASDPTLIDRVSRSYDARMGR
ncbi:MAG TPA: hypothetical protein VMG60_09645 [Burkholderiaceae bacterium]|nr:hypothetical protein [Burkholderiaceae bacterium]